MSVANAYKDMEIIGEPFQVTARQWKVKINFHYADGHYAEKIVRWTPDPIAETPFNARYAFGFRDKGYITIYQGDQEEITRFFKEEAPRQAWYNTIFRWYTMSDMPPVGNLPEGVTPIRVNWEDVQAEGNMIRSADEVTKEMTKLIYPPSTSQYVGEIGDRLAFSAKVIAAFDFINKTTGVSSNCYTFEDKNKNIYVWFTSVVGYTKGETYKIRGTVKAHQEYNGVNQTVLTRVMKAN